MVLDRVFTTAAMSAALEETTVTYEQLKDIEREFDDAETEIIRQQVELTRPLYEKRQKVVSQIPNFWPLVIEQAPPDIDEYIQPSDSVLLLASLTSLSVSQFEIDNGGKGHPRSFAIRWEFAENDYFEDSVLEKKFWYRRARDGEVGYVSEPVPIRWKPGKDLTGGLLASAIRVWEEEVNSANNGASATSRQAAPLTPAQKSLKKRIENSGLGGVSFFAWFGYRGKSISAEENALAVEEEMERKRRRLEGNENEAEEKEENDEADAEDDEDDEDDDGSLEIFPNGDELALAITGDLWPGAIKYFTQAQEQDALSDDDFESDEEEQDHDGSPVPPDRPSKRRKA